MDYEVKPLPYDYDALEGISEQVNRWHHDQHYAGYVEGRNKAEEKLEQMRESGDFSGIRDVKLAESHNASGQILHEIYYDIMGGNGSADSDLEVVQAIEKRFGSFETWEKEFKATAKKARGWCILCFDPHSQKLHNLLVDFHDQGAVWGAQPIVPIDMWEHAYYHDQGPERGKYIDAFLQNLNWDKINEIYKRVS